MLKTIAALKNVKVLDRSAQMKIGGGRRTDCGIKVNGQWYHSGTGLDTANFVGHYVSGYDSSMTQTGILIHEVGAYSGYATNWCCDSCSWNQPVYA